MKVKDITSRSGRHAQSTYAHEQPRKPQAALAGPGEGGRLFKLCSQIANDRRFQLTIIWIIIANAIVIGVETYESASKFEHVLTTIDEVILWIFVCELTIRVLSYGRRPQDFTKSGWNMFDFIVVAAAFVPGLSANATVLRLVRLLRVFRLASTIPQLRILVVALGRSVKPIGYIAVLTVLILYIYAILGWTLYANVDPEHWKDSGTAMLTLFQVLTLEGWNEIYDIVKVEPLAWLYFLSFILIATFVLVNMVIGVIINSVEEAHRMEIEEVSEKIGPEIEEKIVTARNAIDAIEQQLAHLKEVIPIEQEQSEG